MPGDSHLTSYVACGLSTTSVVLGVMHVLHMQVHYLYRDKHDLIPSGCMPVWYQGMLEVR